MIFISTVFAETASVSIGGTASSSADLQAIVLNIYNLALLFGGLLAFVMILFASVKYTLQPGNSSAQGDAKDQILQAFFGLLLLFGAYLVLNTINPEIVGITIPDISDIPSVEEPAEGGTATCDAAKGQCRNSPSVDKVLNALAPEFKSVARTTFQGEHSQNSCHFGGRFCTDGSHAIDWGKNAVAAGAPGKNLDDMRRAASKAIQDAGVSGACFCENNGGTIRGSDCLNPAKSYNHVHCNVDNVACGCN